MSQNVTFICDVQSTANLGVGEIEGLYPDVVTVISGVSHRQGDLPDTYPKSS